MLLLVKRKWRREATKAFRAGVSAFGAILPMKTKISLARRSTKLGYLLASDGDFVVDHYLDTFKVCINTKSTIERLMLTGQYEEDLEWAIRDHVAEGDVCIDIGANVGAASLCLAKAVGDRGKVFSFEPGPAFFSRLQRNIELNPRLQAVIVPCNLGVSDHQHRLHWAEDPEFLGNAYAFGNQGLEIDAVTLDEFLVPQLQRADFLKIDVEGMELEVLRGARELIRRFRPKIFFETTMEFETFRKQPIRKQAAELLADLGYRLFRVTGPGTLTPVEYPHFAQNTLALP